jgi:hypothetical protein
MLTTFIEDRPVKRLRGEEAVHGFQLQNSTSSTVRANVFEFLKK